jgi:hypothetical protein
MNKITRPISHQIVTGKDRVQSEVGQYRTCVSQSDRGKFFSETSGFPCKLSFYHCFILSTIIWRRYNRTIWGPVPAQSHPTSRIQNNNNNNNKFWEELIPYFHWYDTENIENEKIRDTHIQTARWFYKPAFITLLSLLWRKKQAYVITLLSVCLCITPHQLLKAWTSLHETWYAYHGAWTYLNGTLHKSLSSVCVSVCVYLLSLLGDGSVKTFPRQQRIVGGVIFYAVRVISKESRRLVLPRCSCFKIRKVAPKYCKIQWWMYVKRGMNLRTPKEMNFMTNWAGTSF